MEFKYRKTKNTRTDPKTGRRVSMWTDKLDARLHAMYVEKRMSMDKTAKKLGCSVGAVQQRLYKKGWARRRPWFNENTEFSIQNEPEFLIRAYKSGRSAAEIAKDYSLSERKLIDFFKSKGVFRDSPHERHEASATRGKHWSIAQVDHNMRMYLKVDLSQLHWMEYKKLALTVTGHMFRKFKELIDPNGVHGREWHLDHIFAIKAATHKRVDGKWVIRKKFCPIDLIAHPANLQIITDTENQKRKNLPETYDTDALFARVEKFNKRHGDPFRKYR